MSKRLQVILQEADYRQVQHFAQAEQLTVAEWVRRALIAARRNEPTGEAARKLADVRNAASGAAGSAAGSAADGAAPVAYPTADINHMLHEIELGYRCTKS
jgi:hypothetical protein